VSGLVLNQNLRAGDLPLDKNKIKLLTDEATVLSHVVALRVEEEKPVEVVAAVTPAEPEVIKKGKKEVEGEEGAEGGEKQEKKK